MTTDLRSIETSLTSPEAFLAVCTESKVFGAKKKAKAAYEIWTSAADRKVWAYRALRAPGGQGTGFRVGLLWDPTVVTPDFAAIEAAIAGELPVELVRKNEKEVWKARDGKQNIFFGWRGVQGTELSQWFRTRFGVDAFAAQVFDASDFDDNVAVIAQHDGTDRVWLVAC